MVQSYTGFGNVFSYQNLIKQMELFLGSLQRRAFQLTFVITMELNFILFAHFENYCLGQDIFWF